MFMRNLINGLIAEEYEKAVELKVITKCPGKWILVDLENGRMYQGTNTETEYGKWYWYNNPENENIVEIIATEVKDDE